MKDIFLFEPYISDYMIFCAEETMHSTFVGQGPKVKELELLFSEMFHYKYPVSVNSGTTALELIYDLIGLGRGDEVISPVFTCTATNIPLVRRGVKIVFADITRNLTIDQKDVLNKITSRTKAIVNVHLYGKLSKLEKMPVTTVGDCAQYLGWTHADYNAYSFQATKWFTSGDGGILTTPNKSTYKRAKLLRWYGIDREAGKPNIDVDIKEAGYKYHMNDIVASMVGAGLRHLETIESARNILESNYFDKLVNVPGIDPRGGRGPFLAIVDKRDRFIKKLKEAGVEAGLVHRRNDRYTVFGGKRLDLPTMNELENKYVFLPLHLGVTVDDVERICDVIKKGW